MDKSLMIFIAIGLGFLYFVTTFVGDIQKEDEVYRNNGYDQEHAYDKYQSSDSIGQDVLDVTGAPAATQMAAWDSSLLKDEFLMLFPNFSAMTEFAEGRVRGDALKNKLTQTVSQVEDAFFSGTMTAEQAKNKLGSLK
jgi:hypothetical protein